MRNGETAKVTASVVDKDGNPKTGYKGTLTFTLLNKGGEKVKSSTTNPQTFTYTDIINTYGGTVTGYVTLE